MVFLFFLPFYFLTFLLFTTFAAMKMGFLLFMLLPLASIVYVLWHVYQLLPLPTWGKWLVVVLLAMAFGMLFVGVKLMGDAVEPLRSSPVVIEALDRLANPFLAIAIGLVITNAKGEMLYGDSESEIKEIKSHTKFWEQDNVMNAKQSDGEPYVERRQGLVDRSKTIWALVNPNDYEYVAQ